ncbi:MAG: SMP-30/gluconolactonase/LRE family protein [Marinibacterium sp.]|nr:SMP-30/gluconolactonase/LRE family protein [Marinibacterium sp.]
MATRTLGAATVFAKTTDLPGRPDGAAMDADGNYWIAAVDVGEIYVFPADGTLAHRLKAPVQFPTKIGFGGPDGRSIALTSKADAQSGGYLACATLPKAYARGLPTPRWVPGA